MLPYFTRALRQPVEPEPCIRPGGPSGGEEARAQVASLVGARPEEIVFTSGATEADNLAVRGARAGARERRAGTS